MPARRGYTSYAPLESRRGRRPGRGPGRGGPFRHAQFNLAGWSALLGACLVLGGLGLGLARLAGAPTATAVAATTAGVAAPLLWVWRWDRRAWNRLHVTYDWGGTRDQVLAVQAELAARGVSALLDEFPDRATGHRHALRWVRRDTAVVHAVLRAHGIPLPTVP